MIATQKSADGIVGGAIGLDGEDMRRDPLAVRKATLASLLRRAAPRLRLNERLDEEDGPLVFAHACKMGLEGIVSKHKDSRYRSAQKGLSIVPAITGTFVLSVKGGDKILHTIN